MEIVRGGQKFATDKTGRKLKLGQVVDMTLIGVYQGTIVDIKENPIVLPSNQTIPPQVIISVTINCRIDQNRKAPDLCILQDADPEMAEALEKGKMGLGSDA